MKPGGLVLALLLAVPLAEGRAQNARPTTLRVPEAWVRVQGDVSGMSAAYFTIQNTGTVAVMVRSVSCTGIRMASMHESRLEGTTTRMAPRDSIPVPPGQQLVMRPGAVHVMLMGLTRPLSVGQRLSCTLGTSAGDLPAEATVRAN